MKDQIFAVLISLPLKQLLKMELLTLKREINRTQESHTQEINTEVNRELLNFPSIGNNPAAGDQTTRLIACKEQTLKSS